MGPAYIHYNVYYEDNRTEEVLVHITKDQDEADGFIIAARTGKAAYPLSPITSIFRGVTKETLNEKC